MFDNAWKQYFLHVTNFRKFLLKIILENKLDSKIR